jgi:putative ABC transport system ATP-binding protein
VAIARAFIAKTPLLLADEPTGNLDEKNAKNIMEILKNLHKETKNTVLLITHDSDIASYANKVYELQSNNLVLQK